MRIPTTNLGQRVLTPAPAVNAPPGAFGAGTAEAVQRLGNTVGNMADDAMSRDIQQRQAMRRLESAKALQERETQLYALQVDVTDRINRGELGEDEAGGYFDQRVSELPMPELPGLDELSRADLDAGLGQLKQRAAIRLDGVVRETRARRGEATLVSALDEQGKLAGLPDADIDSLHQRGEAFAQAALAAGVPADQVARHLQNAKDRDWTNAATEQLIRSKDSMAGLKQLERDLTAEGGRYVAKLDTERRNALLAQVMGAQDRLVAKVAMEQAKRETSAQRLLDQIERQIPTTVPIKDDTWLAGAAAVKGTALEPEFARLRAEYDSIQKVTLLPVGKQVAYAREQRRKLMAEGGDLQQIAYVQKLENAINANAELVQEKPLELYHQRLGERLPPLAVGDLLQPGGFAAASTVLADRVNTLRTMEKAYGTVGHRPLYEEEAHEMRAALDKLSPTSRARALGGLRTALGDDEMYRGAVAQMYKDDPTKVAAGMAAGMGFKTSEGRMVGDMIEQGAAILRDKSVIAPPKGSADDGTKALFNQHIGEASPVGSAERDMYYQATLSIYAKLAAEEGKLGREVDKPLFRRATNIATGGLIEYRGQTVIAPKYGMPEDEFADRMNRSLKAAATANGLDYGELLEMQFVPIDGRPGAYVLKQDAIRYQPAADGGPLIIEVL